MHVELDKKIQKIIKNNLTHKDLLNLCNHLNFPISGRKNYIQDKLLEYIESLNYEKFASVSNQIEDFIKVSVNNKGRVSLNPKLDNPVNQSAKLLESFLKSGPVNLESEIPVQWRSGLMLPINVPNPNLLTSVPTQANVGVTDYSNIIKLPNFMPSVSISTSPFYWCQICLHPLTLLIPQQMPNTLLKTRITSKATINFTLSDNVKQIINRNLYTVQSKTEYKWQIVLRFVGVDPLKPIPSANEKATEVIPQYLQVTVNGTVQPLWELLPSNCQAKEGKRHPKPVQISDKICEKLSNQSVFIQWYQVPNVFMYYYVGAYLERKLSVNEMLNLFTSNNSTNNRSIEDTLKFITSKLGNPTKNSKREVDDDDDLVISNVLPISLCCPVGKSRIEIPLRTVSCQHLQCFDAHLFLSMNERRSVWKCPICDSQATPNDLFCDKFFEKILKHFCKDDDVTDVNVNADYSFVAIKYKERGDMNKRLGGSIGNNGPATSDNSRKEIVLDSSLVSASDSFIVLDSDDENDSTPSQPIQSSTTKTPTMLTTTSSSLPMATVITGREGQTDMSRRESRSLTPSTDTDFRANVTNVITCAAPVQIQISNNDPSTGSIERRINISNSSTIVHPATGSTISRSTSAFTVTNSSSNSSSNSTGSGINLRPPLLSIARGLYSNNNLNNSIPMYAIPRTSSAITPPPISQGVNIPTPIVATPTSHSFLINSILPKPLTATNSSSSPITQLSSRSNSSTVSMGATNRCYLSSDNILAGNSSNRNINHNNQESTKSVNISISSTTPNGKTFSTSSTSSLLTSHATMNRSAPNVVLRSSDSNIKKSMIDQKKASQQSSVNQPSSFQHTHNNKTSNSSLLSVATNANHITTATSAVNSVQCSIGGKSKNNVFRSFSQTSKMSGSKSTASGSVVSVLSASTITTPISMSSSPCSIPVENNVGQKPTKMTKNTDGKNKINNSNDIEQLSIKQGKVDEDDVVRCFPVLSKSVGNRSTLELWEKSPEPIVCPALIMSNVDETESKKERSTSNSDVVNCLTPPLSAITSSNSTSDISAKPKSIKNKNHFSAPPTNKNSIPHAPLTIDLTEEDDDDHEEVVPMAMDSNDQNNNNSRMFGNTPQQSTGHRTWMPISKPIPGNMKLNGLMGSNNAPNRFSYNERFPIKPNRTSSNMESMINYFKPHQMRNMAGFSSANNNKNNNNENDNSNNNKSPKAIDLTGEDNEITPKKRFKTNDMNSINMRNDKEDGQVDDTDSCSSEEFKRQVSSSTRKRAAPDLKRKMYHS